MPHYSDININIEKITSGDIEEQVEIEAVKNSLGNILSTLQGTRRMLPEFASNMNQLLFDPIDEITAEDIGENVLEAIARWDDRVVVEEVNITPKYDQNRYDISLVFKVKGFDKTEEIDYILKGA